MYKYKYASKYFDFHEKSKIWREINTNHDVQRKFDACESQIKMISEIPIKDRIREDRVDVEKALGEIEIALKRINELPQLFTFSELEIKKFNDLFLKYEDEIHLLDMQRISWN